MNLIYKVRDTYFDAFKGMMILSVINIHTVYWSLKPYTPDILRELAYFVDIPIFFFISGYFVRYSGFLSCGRQALRQLVRLYLRYLVITALVASGTVLWVYFFRDRIPDGLPASLLSMFTLKLSGELWGYFKGYYGNLWYLHTYLPMLLLVPVMVGIPFFPRFKYVVLFVLLILYYLMTYEYKGHVFLLRSWGDIFFYSFFYVLGTVYRIKEEELSARLVLFSFIVNCLVVWFIFQMDGGELRLSRYKFPPSVEWLVYSLLLVHVFVLIRPYWNKTIRSRISRIAPGLEWIGNNSLTVYLIQGLICSIPFLFAGRLAEAVSYTPLLYLLVFSFNATVSISLSIIYTRSENYLGKCYKRIRDNQASGGDLPANQE
jgi:fucose 4-O-acetylase-like acetyltransferase